MDEQSQNLSESIIVGNCLSCHGLVRVPAKAPAKSRVRCPHCSESYALAEILDQAVPELELVEESADDRDTPVVDNVLIKTDQSGEEREKFVVPPQLSQGARRRSRRRTSSSESSDSANDSEFAVDSSSKQDVADDSRRSSGSSRSRSKSRSSSKKSSRRRSEPNTVIELLKVVIGGLLAIPIAYLLVFWVFKQDPLNVGPTLGNVVPFLVPAELRGDPPNNAIDASNKVKQKASTTKIADEDPMDLPIPDVDPDLVKPNGPD